MSASSDRMPKTARKSKAVWPNEGEGNKSADQRYREQTKQFVESGRVKTQAKKATVALDGREGPQLAEAEKKGRSRGRS